MESFRSELENLDNPVIAQDILELGQKNCRLQGWKLG